MTPEQSRNSDTRQQTSNKAETDALPNSVAPNEAEHAENDSTTPELGRMSAWTEMVSIPRWIVYTQAGLLGLVGTLFFLFGILVGHFTTDRSGEVSATFDCRTIGSVAYRVDGDLRGDDGAVVFLLPADKKPDQRAPGNLVNPATFKALDNAAIDRIHELGGAVVRTNKNGQFDVVIDANSGNGIEYYLLIVSKHQRGVDTTQMTKEQNAIISSFFIPVEDVIEDRSYHWMKVKAYQKRLDLPEIEF